MSWEAVAAVAALRSEDQLEFRHRAGVSISLVLEAAGPGLLKRAVAGKLNAFEFKQLVDAYAQLSTQAVIRPEHNMTISMSGPAADLEAMLQRMTDGKSHGVQGKLYDTKATILTGVEVCGMGSHGQKVHALEAGAEPAPGPPE